MQFNILNRWSGSVIFTAEIDCAEDAPPSIKLGLAVKVAVKARANLAGAYLAGAYLAGANLADANLADANLADANMAGANMAGANLAGANLAGAYLAGAKLTDGIKLVGERPVLWIGPIGSRCATMLAFNTDRGIRVRAGCFFDTLNLFEVRVAEEHGDNEHGRAYQAAIAMIRSVWSEDAASAKDAAE